MGVADQPSPRHLLISLEDHMAGEHEAQAERQCLVCDVAGGESAVQGRGLGPSLGTGSNRRSRHIFFPKVSAAQIDGRAICREPFF